MDYLSILQIIVAVSIIVLILFQQRGTALGSAFGGGGGGGSGGGFYATRRGLQEKIYYATIVLGVLFIGLSILNLVV